MQNHSRDAHGAGSVLQPIPKNYGVLEHRDYALAQANQMGYTQGIQPNAKRIEFKLHHDPVASAIASQSHNEK